MANDPTQQVLRLRKKHAPGSHEQPTATDGARLLGAQSLRQATMAGLIVMVVFAMFWAVLSGLLGRIFPWMTLLLGMLLGLAVQRAGRGIDWRFPSLAATLAFAGSILCNLVLAAGTTARYYETSTMEVLRNVTINTWPYFFSEAMTAADWVFALFAAGIAAFYANRRLNRRDYQALRIWRDTRDAGDRN